MEDYKVKLEEEFIDLHERVLKLEAFIRTSDFRCLKKEKKDLIVMQLYPMKQYRRILAIRCWQENIVSVFNKTKTTVSDFYYEGIENVI